MSRIVSPPRHPLHGPAQLDPHLQKYLRRPSTVPAQPLTPKAAMQSVGYWGLAWLWIGLIIYGSLLPFEFRPQPELYDLSDRIDWLREFLRGPAWVMADAGQFSFLGISSRLSDTLTNLLLYAPAAILLRLDLHRRGLGLIGVFFTVVLLGGLSWLIECAQGQMPLRVASLPDVLLNTGGALAAALVAVWLRDHGKKWVFKAYCKVSILVIDSSAWVQQQRDTGAAMRSMLVSNVLMLLSWAVMAWLSADGTNPGKINWLPFGWHFHLAYDAAAWQMGKSMLYYALIAAPMAALWASVRNTTGWLKVVVTTVTLVTAHEAFRLLLSSRTADVTEPILAAFAAGAVLVLAHLAHRAVRSCCRRKQSVVVPVERRRRRHNYEGVDYTKMRKNPGNTHTPAAT